MSEEFEEISLSGGKLIIRDDGSVQFTHDRPTPSTLFPIRITCNGIITDEDGSNPQYHEWQMEVFLVSDLENMFGRTCPQCRENFRISAPTGRLRCPYCNFAADATRFSTAAQLRYIQAYVEEIRRAYGMGQREVDLDALIANIGSAPSPFSYKETRQQTQIRCQSCQITTDIFGLYSACPRCGRRNSLDLFHVALDRLADRVDNPRYPASERHLREAEWEDVVKAAVSTFEGLARDIVGQLARLPATARRRKQLKELSFMNPSKFHDCLLHWFDIDVLTNFSEGDKAFITKYFARRHLFTHCSGVADQEYIDISGDSSIRVGQKVRVRSQEAKRTIDLIRKMGKNVFVGFENIGPESPNYRLQGDGE